MKTSGAAHKKSFTQSASQIIGEVNVSEDHTQMAEYGFTPASRPDVLVRPGSAAELQTIVRLAIKERVPLIPVGGGTRIGQVLTPFQGGAAIALDRLTNILEYEPDNHTVIVEAGLPAALLQHKLRQDRLQLPLPADDPRSTVGGQIAANYSSWKRYRHGSAADYLLGASFLSPTGVLVSTGGKTMKNVSGYDLTKLVAGSWGTTGILSSLTLRLVPYAKESYVAIGCYADARAAMHAARALPRSGATVTSLNLMHGPLPGTSLHREGRFILVFAADGSVEAVEKLRCQLDLISADNGLQPVSPADAETAARALAELRRLCRKPPYHTVSFDKRDADRMTEAIALIAQYQGSVDLDLTGGVLEFSFPDTAGATAAEFFATFDRLRSSKRFGTMQASFTDQEPAPLLNLIRKKIDPHQLMFPGNRYVRGRCHE